MHLKTEAVKKLVHLFFLFRCEFVIIVIEVFFLDDARLLCDHNAVVRYIFYDDAIGADPDVVSQCHFSDDLGAGSKITSISDQRTAIFRMPYDRIGSDRNLLEDNTGGTDYGTMRDEDTLYTMRENWFTTEF